MSNRLAFALAVPLMVIMMAGLVVVDVVGLGFAGEGCRNHDGRAMRWGAAAEAALVQLVFGVLFAMALAVLSALLRRRLPLAGPAQVRRWFETAAITGLLLMLLGGCVAALVCQMAPYATIATVLLWSGLGLLLAALALLTWLYVKGMMAHAE